MHETYSKPLETYSRCWCNYGLCQGPQRFCTCRNIWELWKVGGQKPINLAHFSLWWSKLCHCQDLATLQAYCSMGWAGLQAGRGRHHFAHCNRVCLWSTASSQICSALVGVKKPLASAMAPADTMLGTTGLPALCHKPGHLIPLSYCSLNSYLIRIFSWSTMVPWNEVV